MNNQISKVNIKNSQTNCQALSNQFTGADVLALAASDVARALEEDVKTLDLTAGLIDSLKLTQARIIAREAGVLCGTDWVNAAILKLDASAQLDWLVAEGARFHAGQTILNIHGLARPLLTAERTALNFLQTLSAVATKTAQYVACVEGTKANIVDTRKTLPGLRMAQKYAVWCGGGVNHRIGLYDAVLIKENHIAAAGGITEVLKRATALAPSAKFIQIEVENLTQLSEALQAGAAMILLDNMGLNDIRQAVAINQTLTNGLAVLEVSGGVTLNGLRELAETGIDRISIGTLTKDVKAIDFSMRFEYT
jgi:nicotinate-nucleotide pyrophosphorylase (carboxylating)